MDTSTPQQPLPVAVILCRPEISRNIGAVCRSMANSNCSDLRIVGNKKDYDEAEILRLASHAGALWQNARFFEPSITGLKASVADCCLVAGTTRRVGEKRKSWGMTPEDFALFSLNTAEGLTGIVFGNERTGLTDEELDVCSVAVNIPSAPDFPSLNLSHAVQIVCYTLFRAYSPRKYGYERIPYTRVASAAEHINSCLCNMGLFKHAGKDDNIRFFQEIIARAGLSSREARYLEELFQKLCYVKCRNVVEKGPEKFLPQTPLAPNN